MTPLPAVLGDSGELVAWRLDKQRYAATWDSGEGAYRVGGRWNAPGSRAVYCALDPSTAILEVAVHTGFDALDTVPHVLTSVTIRDPTLVHIVRPEDVPNPNWLRPGTPSRGQQLHGETLLLQHRVFVIPSEVSTRSWNLVFDAAGLGSAYGLRSQELFALDTRLNPPLP